MNARGLLFRWLSALCLTLPCAPQALTLALLAQPRAATCGCSSRACCCTRKVAFAGRRACHAGVAESTSTAASTWRCRHVTPVPWLAGEPALLARLAPRPWAPPARRPVYDVAWAPLLGFVRLDSPPPRLLLARG